MKTSIATLTLLSTLSLGMGQDAVDAAVEMELPRKKKAPKIQLKVKKEALSGASVKFFRSESPFRIFSPVAPKEDGSGEENQGEVAINKDDPGFKGITFFRFSW